MGPQPTQMVLQQAGLGSGQQVLFGQLAKPSSPRETEGTYWGYTTRLATSLSQVFQDCPFEVCCKPMRAGLLVLHMPSLLLCLQNLNIAMQSCASLCRVRSHCLLQRFFTIVSCTKQATAHCIQHLLVALHCVAVSYVSTVHKKS